VSQGRLCRDQSLNDYGLGVPPHFLHIDLPFLREVCEGETKGPLVTDRIVIRVLVLHKVVRVLVDRVISQVHAHVLDVVLVDFLIGLSGKASEAIFEEKDPEGVHPEY
jgi:hypothetical protein